ncbi:S49 family peptidase [Alterisphingorhabdus coralli]|uniref:S49 family peptidase n=1 Tax=Alterisphingorhabdus coralli TaxID=3071408 RepID=A0AA97F8H8_9SPHN|nr:S49 family peptidase [Parasphingorhabdus sp. SCSIO 66989]WOE76314.1 S49 family peptidase [Parasphingorhabdus sp. SCSIO 66989]
MTNNTILSRFDKVPALLNPNSESWFEARAQALSEFLNANIKLLSADNDNTYSPSGRAVDNDDGYWPSEDSWLSAYRPYNVMNGTLHIPVKGILLTNFGYTISDWATGYEYVCRALSRGLADSAVERIALRVDSGGGAVAECFDCADRIYAARQVKPVETFVSENAYSAAYALASASSAINLERTAGAGSIGVVISHMDMSKRMEAMGVNITFVHAGKHKVDGNAYAPLSDEMKSRLQVRVDEIYDVFVSQVARNRGLNEQVVRDTEARIYSAAEALSLGLVSQVGPMDELLSSFEADNPQEQEQPTMSKENTDTSAAENEAAVTEARAEGRKAGIAEGIAAERERQKTIRGCDAAKTRPIAAENVAMNTDMSAEDAEKFLANMPEETTMLEEATTTQSGSFEQAMATGNLDLDANVWKSEQEDENANEGQAGANTLLAARKAMTGFGPSNKAA